MLNRLIDFAVHRRATTLLATLAFAIFGVVSFRKLKIEAFPDVTNVQVMVITLFPGQAPEEVEKQVTIPVERALNGTPQVLVQRSITSFGLSQVILTFEDDVDIYWARQQVAERLPDAEVPEGIAPHLGPNDTPVGQIYQYTLESDHHSPSELRSWQDWVGLEAADARARRRRRRQLRRLPEGVPRARRPRSPARQRADAAGPDHGGGGVERRHLGRVSEVRRDRVRRPRPRLSQGHPRHREHRHPREATARRCWSATSPRWSSRTRRGAGRWRAARQSTPSRGRCCLRRGENPKDVLDGVHAAVDRINRDVLPTGMKIVPFYDRTRLVDTTLKTVSHNMLEGVTLVSLVLWLFLRTVAGSLAVAVTMPLALLTAFVGLHFAGVPANLLSMGAIDFGILLDGAVILVENAYRHLAEERPPPELSARRWSRAPPRRWCGRRCSRWRSSSRR